MKFEEEFNENVEYCKYVYRKLTELEIELEPRDIQRIANDYAEELENRDMYDEDEVVEDDSILLKIIQKYLKTNKKEGKEYINYDLQELLARLRLENEKQVHANGGHGYTDSYDDLSYEDLNDVTRGR